MKTASSTTIAREARALADDASTGARRVALQAAARIVERKHPRDYDREELANALDVAPHGVKWYDALASRLGL